MNLNHPFQLLSRGALALLVLLLAAGCSAAPEAAGEEAAYPMASMQDMPANVRSAPANVQQAYQFAVANPEALQQIPCYCGCGAMGHTSNYSCYVQQVGPDGEIQYDTHALGCSICVDITRDTMRMLDEGKPIAEIQASIDRTFGQYGPSNLP
ncbi:MAG: hypothetical protein GYA17_04415 [Chloroflexi bacterium]|nr:PCYCGC motif-containing (lipo)protein [Anaerolineaceae bacterium]NMB87580.1 hypothetical protein [Chloroflexota bacterium]